VSRRDERGSGLVELIWLGLILLLPVVYVVVTAAAVQRGAYATTAAARAAARAFALADTDQRGRAEAQAAARRAFADQGLPGQSIDVRIDCPPRPICHQGGAVISVAVRTRVALPLLPALLGGHAPGIGLDAGQTVPIGQYQEVRDAP
jgi:Flp pilus assembly protein TadG